MPALRVHLSPVLFRPEDLRGGAAVVIDLIRASTTIVHALGAGARAILPCEEVQEAISRRPEHPSCKLGGERGGVLIPGFDLGNSPSDYTPSRVAGRTLLFTTTNGTRALRRCSLADHVWVGAFANFHAVVEKARLAIEGGRPAHLVCAGIHGHVCLEDTLCAGAMVEAIRRATDKSVPDDAAEIAGLAWLHAGRSVSAFRTAIEASQGGRNLASVGLTRDLEDVTAWDRFNLVPELDSETGMLVPGIQTPGEIRRVLPCPQ